MGMPEIRLFAQNIKVVGHDLILRIYLGSRRLPLFDKLHMHIPMNIQVG